ncbi:MAG TPA: 16S rRNA (cytosine(1402)-N(4))-methyltransferase, partial [Oscillospiraceae bacterium]|nr:16S rRNA (cytosine(1402)-N(4))-methyltransferase [Oscillospiraceae bacterium]
MSGTFRHTPVLLMETVSLLAPERGGTFVDGTLGGGGHAEAVLRRLPEDGRQAVLRRLPEDGRLIGIDRDWEAVHAAEGRLSEYGGRFYALHGNFFQMRALLGSVGVTAANGILLDLGVSSHQLDAPERGFSYRTDAPLDMRMDTGERLTAYDVVNGYDAEALMRILWEYGEER